MKQLRRVVSWIAVGVPVLVLLGVLACELLQSAPSIEEGPGDPHVVAEARLAVVREASVVLLPGAHLLAVEGAAEVFGDQSSCGSAEHGSATYAGVLRRRVDVSEVASLGEQAGAVRVLLELARAQQVTLERVGFNAMSAAWAAVGGGGRQRVTAEQLTSPLPPEAPSAWGAVESEQPRPAYAPPGSRWAHVRDRHQSDSGGGGGVTQVDLLAPRIVHHRIYVIPKSGASLFVRNVLDQAARTVDVELSYVDRTVFGVEVPTGSYVVGRQPGHYSLHEELVSPP